MYNWFDKPGSYVFSQAKENYGLTFKPGDYPKLVGPYCDDINDPDTCVYGFEYVYLKCDYLEDLSKLKFHPWSDYKSTEIL